MKRKSLIEAVSPEARHFIEAGTPKPQRAEGEASPELLSLHPKTIIDPPVPSPVLVPQTFRLPQPLVEDLARAAIERKIKRRKPWSQQDIVAEAIKEWLRKIVNE